MENHSKCVLLLGDGIAKKLDKALEEFIKNGGGIK